MARGRLAAARARLVGVEALKERLAAERARATGRVVRVAVTAAAREAAVTAAATKVP